MRITFILGEIVFKGMVKGMKEFTPLFQGFIAFMALIGGFTFSVDYIVKPLKTEIELVKENQKDIKENQVRFEIAIKENQKALEENQKDLKEIKDLIKFHLKQAREH